MIYKQFGKTVVVTEGNQVHKATLEKEAREEVKQLVEKHENSKSEKAKTTLLNKIVKIMGTKQELVAKETEKKVTKLKAEKKLAKKKALKDTTEDKSEMVLAKSIEEDLNEQELNDLKDRNRALEEENRKLKESLEKASDIKPVVSNTGVSRRGEY